jgi:hypothetical protein
MSLRGEIWVHGNSAVAQFPGGAGQDAASTTRLAQVDKTPFTDIVGLRTGPGIRFKAEKGNSNWFHFSIPTPAVFPRPDQEDHSLIEVDKVSVYYKTDGKDVFIKTIMVFDGSNSRTVFQQSDTDPSPLFDDHTGAEDEHNAFPVNPTLPGELFVAHGVGISVEVKFNADGEIFFKGAAIHFSVS